MSLKCRRCGIKRSHAGASIADNLETCEVTREAPDGSKATLPARHNWRRI